MKSLLNKLLELEPLSATEAKSFLFAITENELNDAQIVAGITAIKIRKITSEELNGFREALLELAVIPELDTRMCIDVCGTGGDGKNTFNISTLSAFVLATMGYKVAKHGNYGVSSICGSSTVLNYLGFEFTANEQMLQRQLKNTNLCFLHAPLFHPALKRVGNIRKDLGTSTFFNYLGPLVNPVQPPFQLTGVFNLELLRLYKEVLQKKRESFRIVHSLDGYDELSLTGPFKLVSEKAELLLTPDDIGVKTLTPESIVGGGSIEGNAKQFLEILSGRGTESQNSAVAANVALGIQILEPSTEFQDAYLEAIKTLVSGKALSTFQTAIHLSQTA